MRSSSQSKQEIQHMLRSALETALIVHLCFDWGQLSAVCTRVCVLECVFRSVCIGVCVWCSGLTPAPLLLRPSISSLTNGLLPLGYFCFLHPVSLRPGGHACLPLGPRLSPGATPAPPPLLQGHVGRLCPPDWSCFIERGRVRPELFVWGR